MSLDPYYNGLQSEHPSNGPYRRYSSRQLAGSLGLEALVGLLDEVLGAAHDLRSMKVGLARIELCTILLTVAAVALSAIAVGWVLSRSCCRKDRGGTNGPKKVGLHPVESVEAGSPPKPASTTNFESRLQAAGSLRRPVPQYSIARQNKEPPHVYANAVDKSLASPVTTSSIVPPASGIDDTPRYTTGNHVMSRVQYSQSKSRTAEMDQIEHHDETTRLHNKTAITALSHRVKPTGGLLDANRKDPYSTVKNRRTRGEDRTSQGSRTPAGSYDGNQILLMTPISVGGDNQGSIDSLSESYFLKPVTTPFETSLSEDLI